MPPNTSQLIPNPFEFLSDTKSHTSSSVRRVCVFGDSWSDTGRVHELTNGTWPRDVYHKGRFSNGLLWHEHASQMSFANAVTWNFAHGGATSDNATIEGFTGPNSEVPVPGLLQQVELYIEALRSEHTFTPHALPSDYETVYVLSLAGNDFYFSAHGRNPQLPRPAVIAHNLVRAMQRLHDDVGARVFLVTEMPPLGTYPFWNPSVLQRTAFSFGAAIYNRNLHACVDAFREQNADTIVSMFRQNGLVGKICASPATFGFSHGSVAFNAQAHVSEDVPSADEYIFYDAFHPTAKMHRLLGEACAEVISCEIVPKLKNADLLWNSTAQEYHTLASVSLLAL